MSLIAGQKLWQGDLCVRIDNVFYHVRPGDENSNVYVAMDNVEEGSEVEMIMSTSVLWDHRINYQVVGVLRKI